MKAEPTDEEKLRTFGERIVSFWDRTKITIMGLSILAAVLSTTWLLSGQQSEIQSEIKSVATTVGELKTAFKDLSAKHEVTTGTVATHDSRLVAVEVWQRGTSDDFQSAKDRLGFIERLLMGAQPPKVELR